VSDTVITAEVIKDSLNVDSGSRLTTLVIHFPRVILPQVLTHRMFSRNTSSSRAIPTKKLLDREPWIPKKVGINKPGMSADEYLEGEDLERFRDDIFYLHEAMADEIEELARKYNIHKQTLNRYLEPWMMTTMIVTATEWDNFFALRLHHDAQPEIQELAVKIKAAMDASTPRQLKCYQWHIPFITPEESEEMQVSIQLKIATARCARVSYLTHDGTLNHVKDITLHDKLLADKHMSPFEHCAQAVGDYDNEVYGQNLMYFSTYRSHVEHGRIVE